MRIVTANVNGIRAAARRGIIPWLEQAAPDVLTLQEVRASDAHLEQVLAEAGLGEWHLAHTEGNAKGRAGVAVVTRAPHVAVRVGLDGAFVDHGRWVEVDVATTAGPLTVVSAYVHAGEANSPRQIEKYAFLDAMGERMVSAAAAGELMLVTGDLNVGHTEDDIKNWKGNRGKSGFLPEERSRFDHWFAHGWVDVHRALHGPGPGPYTWWSWRGQAFDNDSGWRIDYQLATSPLAATATSAYVGRAPSYAERWSDHAPVVVDYAL